jgi:hypothetical protein
MNQKKQKQKIAQKSFEIPSILIGGIGRISEERGLRRKNGRIAINPWIWLFERANKRKKKILNRYWP